jgi:hypothetical protein
VPIRTFQHNMIRCPEGELASVPKDCRFNRRQVSQVDKGLGAIVDLPDFIRIIEFGPAPCAVWGGVAGAGGVSTFHFDPFG